MDGVLPAATQSGGCGCCAGGGSTTMSSNCQKRPRCENGARDVQARVMTSIDSSKRACASSGGMQKPANSLWRYPLPTPKSNRPPQMRSSVAACSASSTGLCQGSTITAGPRGRGGGGEGGAGCSSSGGGNRVPTAEMSSDDK